MSKTARGCRSRRGRESKQRLAILPWPSDSPLIRTGIHCPSLQSAACGCRTNGGGIWPSANERADCPRANFSTANTKPFNQPFVAPFVGAP